MKNRLLIFLFILLGLCYPLKGLSQQVACFSRDGLGELDMPIMSDFFNKRFFIIGEFHDFVQVPEVKLAMIKYLNKNNRICDIFMEIGQSAAFLYNQYLLTGDTSFITEPSLVYNTQKESKLFWQKLYVYNKTLQRKIVIHGMDFERMEFIKAIQMLKVNTAMYQSPLLHFIDSVHIAAVNSDTMNKIYSRLKTDMESNAEMYKAVFGANYEQVRNILLNENTYLKYNKRNETMYSNVYNEITRSGIGQFVIFAGLNHVDRSDKGTLTGKLLADSLFKDHAVNISMVCKGCYSSKKSSNKNDFYSGPSYTYNTRLMATTFDRYASTGCLATIIPSAMINDKNVQNYSEYLMLINASEMK